VSSQAVPNLDNIIENETDFGQEVKIASNNDRLPAPGSHWSRDNSSSSRRNVLGPDSAISRGATPLSERNSPLLKSNPQTNKTLTTPSRNDTPRNVLSSRKGTPRSVRATPRTVTGREKDNKLPDISKVVPPRITSRSPSPDKRVRDLVDDGTHFVGSSRSINKHSVSSLNVSQPFVLPDLLSENSQDSLFSYRLSVVTPVIHVSSARTISADSNMSKAKPGKPKLEAGSRRSTACAPLERQFTFTGYDIMKDGRPTILYYYADLFLNLKL
jgi:hypothetical protein